MGKNALKRVVARIVRLIFDREDQVISVIHLKGRGRQFEITDFSVSMWINADAASGLQTFFAQGEAGASPTYALLTSDGDLQWFVGEAPAFATSTNGCQTQLVTRSSIPLTQNMSGYDKK